MHEVFGRVWAEDCCQFGCKASLQSRVIINGADEVLWPFGCLVVEKQHVFVYVMVRFVHYNARWDGLQGRALRQDHLREIRSKVEHIVGNTRYAARLDHGLR